MWILLDALSDKFGVCRLGENLFLFSMENVIVYSASAEGRSRLNTRTQEQ